MNLTYPENNLVYHEKQSPEVDEIQNNSYSKSPIKPRLLYNKLKELNLLDKFTEINDIQPFTREDFLIAHTEEYVDNFLNKTGNYDSNRLPWSESLVESVKYSNSILLKSIEASILSNTLTTNMISGTHHAKPHSGAGFCTFSGQVICSIKIYEKHGISGCYVDLDGHYGNSIEDTRSFNPKTNLAIPEYANINIQATRQSEYILEYRRKLENLKQYFIDGKLHYVVFCHGADSHVDDDLGSGCLSTEAWIYCAEIFANWVNEVNMLINKRLPVITCLFGGYRKDNYDFVLGLHLCSIFKIREILCQKNDVKVQFLRKNRF